jgi:hypothetical protein
MKNITISASLMFCNDCFFQSFPGITSSNNFPSALYLTKFHKKSCAAFLSSGAEIITTFDHLRILGLELLEVTNGEFIF